MGIIFSGDFLAFLKEALNLRSAYATYRSLASWLVKAAEAGETADQHLMSGIELGNGAISLILSLLPSKALKIMDVFGYSGDRQYGLTTLLKTGGWTRERAEPLVSAEQEGIRRPICGQSLHYQLLRCF